MALVACKDCAKEFSTDSKKCPNCGAKKPKAPSNFWKYAIIIFFGLAFIQSLSAPKDPKVIAENEKQASIADMRVHVAVVCKIAVKKTLNDPDSAEFEEFTSPITDLHNDQYKMLLKFRARNGFNALRAAVADCRVKHADNRWSVVSVKQLR